MTFVGNNFLQFLLNAVFPRFCVSCGHEGELLCSRCTLEWRPEPPQCSAEHLAVYAYANPGVRKLICAWKYEYDQSAFEILTAQARVQGSALQQIFSERKIQAIAALPLSAKRWRERGFNQSQLIATWLAKEFQVPVLNILGREHRSGHQAERTVEQRQVAMQSNPFYVKNPAPQPMSILLVDDVWTTGSTLLAAKEVLERDGNVTVFCFTLAKG